MTEKAEEIIISNIYEELPEIVLELNRLFPRDKPLYLVGGAVRDFVLGKKPSDMDFTTKAKPEEIIKITKKWADGIWTVGMAFGTVGIIKNNQKLEITTFRSDVYEHGTRKPQVTFSETIEDDLIRRDFTVNAMAYHINKKALIDPCGGMKDLKDKILKTPREVGKSFTEDPLRMLRAIAFKATLDMDLSVDVFNGVVEFGHLIKTISSERIADELIKMLTSPRPSEALRLLFYTKLSDHFLPEFSALDIEQPTGYHHKNVLEHTLMVVDNAAPDPVLRLAALFHDIAKPKTRKLIEKRVHFYGHDILGAKMTRAALRRLKFSSNIVSQASKLVEMHMRPHTYREGVWTDSAVRRYIRDAGDILSLLNQLATADCTSLKPKVAWAAVEKQKELERQIEEVLRKEDIRAIKPLLNGHEIMEKFNIKPGPMVGKIQKTVLEAQIDGKIENKEEAWQLAQTIFKQSYES